MIKNKLLDWNYYLKKIPLYLRNSYGFTSHFEIMFVILKAINDIGDGLLTSINLFDKNYFENVKELITDVDEDGTTFDLLDKFASLYNINRNLDINYDDGNGHSYTGNITLKNSELLKFILVRCVLSNYDGTYENLRSLYDLINLPIMFINSPNESAFVSVVLYNPNGYFDNSNIIHLFYSRLLNLESVGIRYAYQASEFIRGEFDTEGKGWNEGNWS